MTAVYKRVRAGVRTAAEHRLVMEAYIGAKLLPEQVVHHINGDKRDNRIENLELMLGTMHLTLHANERAGRTKALKVPRGCITGREARERLEVAIARAGGADALARKWCVPLRQVVRARAWNSPMVGAWLAHKLGLTLESVYRVNNDADDPREGGRHRPAPWARLR